LGNELISRLL